MDLEGSWWTTAGLAPATRAITVETGAELVHFGRIAPHRIAVEAPGAGE